MTTRTKTYSKIAITGILQGLLIAFTQVLVFGDRGNKLNHKGINE